MFEITAPTEERQSLIWFVSRHPGALDWARRSGIAFDRHVAHLDTGKIGAGDTVIGSLPVNLAAEKQAQKKPPIYGGWKLASPRGFEPLLAP